MHDECFGKAHETTTFSASTEVRLSFVSSQAVEQDFEAAVVDTHECYSKLTKDEWEQAEVDAVQHVSSYAGIHVELRSRALADASTLEG